MPTYRLTLEYDGTRYHGWQEQQNARSIAGELRRALEEVVGPVGEIGGSGRTDAGVHALAQSAHLRLARAVAPEQVRWEVNARLPPDIHLLAMEPAPAGFHARHSAVSRSYLYQISRRRTAFGKRYVWWVRRALDEGRMAAAAALVAGRHDFRLFCERPAEQPSTVVVVEGVEIAVDGALLLVRFRASHFLWKMVRRLTGALVRVGAGEVSAERFAGLLDPGGEAVGGGAGGGGGRRGRGGKGGGREVRAGEARVGVARKGGVGVREMRVGEMGTRVEQGGEMAVRGVEGGENEEGRARRAREMGARVVRAGEARPGATRRGEAGVREARVREVRTGGTRRGEARVGETGGKELWSAEARAGESGSAELPAEWTAPPSGLFLERVIYPGDPPLAPIAPAVPVRAEER
jgi:tRNA pseudouridine38-40 synthase